MRIWPERGKYQEKLFAIEGVSYIAWLLYTAMAGYIKLTHLIEEKYLKNNAVESFWKNDLAAMFACPREKLSQIWICIY